MTSFQSASGKAPCAADGRTLFVAHGRWYDRDGVVELRRAFRDIAPQ